MGSSNAPVCQVRIKTRTARDAFWKRQGIKSLLWIFLPLTIVFGWLYPVLGFVVVGCMLASVGISFWRGRAWCDFCPRGTFFDVVMSRWSGNRSVPKFLRSLPWRIFVLAFLMGMMTFQLTLAWGNPGAMGRVFWMLLTVTTVVGIVLAFPYNARTWCSFCPMGSMASWIGKKKQPLNVDPEKCTSCGLCARVCPMELYPGDSRDEGIMMNGDCLKCSRCVVSCARGALSFDRSPKNDTKHVNPPSQCELAGAECGTRGKQ